MEQPETDSEAGLLERLGNALMPEAPVEEAVEASQEEEVADSEQPEEEAAAPEDDGFVELELEDGETVRVPPKLKDGYLRQSDYTKKTQDLAALQKNAQSLMQQQALAAQFQEQTREDSQKLAEVQAELKRMKGVDWTTLDAETIWKTRAYVDNLKDQANDLEKSINTKKQGFQQQFTRNRAEAAKSAYDYISKHVKGWTPDSQTEREVASFASQYGIPPETLGEISVMFPGFAVLAHKAATFDKLQAGTGKAVQKAQKAPPVVKPGPVTSTQSAQSQKYKATRDELKKSGSLDAFQRALLQKGIL